MGRRSCASLTRRPRWPSTRWRMSCRRNRRPGCSRPCTPEDEADTPPARIRRSALGSGRELAEEAGGAPGCTFHSALRACHAGGGLCGVLTEAAVPDRHAMGMRDAVVAISCVASQPHTGAHSLVQTVGCWAHSPGPATSPQYCASVYRQKRPVWHEAARRRDRSSQPARIGRTELGHWPAVRGDTP